MTYRYPALRKTGSLETAPERGNCSNRDSVSKLRWVIFLAEFGPTRCRWICALSSSSRCASSRSMTSAILIDRLQSLSGFLQGVSRCAGQSGLLCRFQFCTQLQSFFPLLKGFDAHDHQIAFSVFGDIDRLSF